MSKFKSKLTLLGHTLDEWGILAGLYGWDAKVVHDEVTIFEALEELKAKHLEVTGSSGISTFARQNVERNLLIFTSIQDALQSIDQQLRLGQ